jgi:hypothetical protein
MVVPCFIAAASALFVCAAVDKADALPLTLALVQQQDQRQGELRPFR